MGPGLNIPPGSIPIADNLFSRLLREGSNDDRLLDGFDDLLGVVDDLEDV